jgi:soluble lytic murein transglycosylase
MDFASILKPLLAYSLSASDAANLKEAFRASFKRDAAAAATAKITDPAARKLATWYEYMSGGLDAPAEAIDRFRLANPEWPGQAALREQAEKALFLTDASAPQIKAFFGDSPPLTGAGKAALATAYLKDGNQPAAHALIVSAWRDYQLNAAVAQKILARFSTMLNAEDHQARIDRLLYPDSKSATDAALKISKLLPADQQKKVTARIAVVNRGKNAGKLLDALPASTTAGDVGLLFNRIQWLRRKDRDEEAWKMLLDAPSEPDKLLDLDDWWVERRVNCRAALNAGQTRIAYEIAVKHGPISGDAYMEAEFLAGWIALRFLSEPNTALGHFFALRTAAKSSKSMALAEYWLGRTALALGDRGSATIHFHAAAKYPQFFYGQLGRQALDANPANLEVTPTPLPTDADIQRFLARDAVRAIGIALAADMKQVTPQFFLALSRNLKSPAEVVLLAELAKLSGNQQISLRLAKIAFNRDLPVGDYALPIGVLPEFKSLLAERVDPALVHALSRQESEFNAGAKSSVGASGLMQLMPGTAKAVAKQHNVKFQVAQLTDPAYNIQLGEAHLRDLIDSYSGSYFLALAAYNAGGGRVQEWIRAFGDPRSSRTDPIDWIERIPFTETREYVEKIMETLQLYRSRLAGPKKALQLVQDLNRGRMAGGPRMAGGTATAAVILVQAKSE